MNPKDAMLSFFSEQKKICLGCMVKSLFSDLVKEIYCRDVFISLV